LFIAIFVSVERLYSLRSGLIFPRKVAKALNSGEFPNRKWKKRSAAERIVWVATKEKPSVDSLRSYSRLEIAAMERGLFLLEVVVSAAPLLGLLGTVTGLVQVFSQIPAGGGAGDPSIFSEGIAMALLTTIAGLAIAIPTLIFHSYLVRLIEKRASSLDWLTERIVDAVHPTHDIKLD
jgi:biopolymer transport protein ExbB